MDKDQKDNRSALKVNKGVEQPRAVNPSFKNHLKKFKKQKTGAGELFEGIRNGDIPSLGRAITLIESRLSADQTEAKKLIAMCLPYAGNSVRIGITGVPGAGKSTFIESFGLRLIGQKHKVAVLAIDPSSTRSKGSILGDKTRMERLSGNPEAFIRPSASAGTLGGIARKTRESIILCEAAGFDRIFVETVGVGQSETAVAGIVDFFLLLMLAGGGDELQGIKRGIMEMADMIVINKADGDNRKKARLARQQYENALHLFPPMESGWKPPVITASALHGTGLDIILNRIDEYLTLTRSNGYFYKNRQRQNIRVFEENIRYALIDRFFRNPPMKNEFEEYRRKIEENKISPYDAADELLSRYFDKPEK